MQSRPRQMGPRRSVAIVASQYNAEYVQGLVSHAVRELGVIAAESSVQRYEVPGAFEIPLAVQEIAERGGVNAIITLGVIIQGQTEHAQLIGHAVTHSLLDLSLRYRIPVIHEVLLVADEEQARRRCLGEEMNRGTEAARTAARMMQAMQELKGRSS